MIATSKLPTKAAEFGRDKEVRDKEKMENMNIEEAFENIEDVLEKLRAEDVSLEDSFAYYKDGMELLKCVSDKIDRVEKQVQVLEEGNLNEF